MVKPVAGYSRPFRRLLASVVSMSCWSFVLSCERPVRSSAGPLGEPVFDPTVDVLVFRDNFEEYTSFADMSNSGAHPQRFQPYGFTAQMSLQSPGSGGAGNYISAIYYGTGGGRPFLADRKNTSLKSSPSQKSYAVFFLIKK